MNVSDNETQRNVSSAATTPPPRPVSLSPTTVDPLTASQVENLLVAILHCPALFEEARQQIEGDDFLPAKEVPLRIVWDAAVGLVNRHGPGILFDSVAKAQTHLTAEIQTYLDRNADEVSQDEKEQLLGNAWSEGLVGRIYGTDAAVLDEGYARETFVRFLQERQIWDRVRRLVTNAGDCTAVDLGPFLEDLQRRIGNISGAGTGQIQSLADELTDFQKRLEIYRGRSLLGLATGMRELDRRTLGMRGLSVLGGGPGCGKTTLALQMGLGICQQNPDCVLVMLSLEMDRQTMYTRLLCNMARLDWKTVMMGSEICRKLSDGMRFTETDLEKLNAGMSALGEPRLSSRILILDRNCLGPELSVASIQAVVAKLKQQTQARRAFIVIDYLQLIPVPANLRRSSELEADRYRVQVVSDLAAATKTAENPMGDAVLVISETRKPSGRQWGNNLSDLMGSARLPYAVDAAFLYQPLDDEGVRRYGWPAEVKDTESVEGLQAAGIAPIELTLAKGRDGMMRGEWPLAFYYQQSRFEEISGGAAKERSVPRPTRPASQGGQFLPPGSDLVDILTA